MPTLGERPLWKPGDPIHLLIWGKLKTGKTYGAGTAPRPNFLDYDNGTLTLQGMDFVAKHGWRPEIRYQRFDIGTRDKRGVVINPKAFDESCTYFDEEMTKHSDKFDTWIVDTGTSLLQASSDKALWLLSGTYQGQKSETLAQGIKHGLILPKQQDFGAERSMTEQFIDMLKGTKKNVIVLCHEFEEQNEKGVVTSRGPLFTGKSREIIPSKFDEVYRLTSRKYGTDIISELTTKTDGINKVGSRLGVPDGTVWDWTTLYAAMVKCYNTATSTKGK